jgi:hypothetical protein
MNTSDLQQALAALPWSNESESSVLGALLLDNEAWDSVGDVLKPDQFYDKSHRLIFGAVGALINAGKPADVITVYGHLQNLSASSSSSSSIMSTPDSERCKSCSRVHLCPLWDDPDLDHPKEAVPENFGAAFPSTFARYLPNRRPKIFGRLFPALPKPFPLAKLLISKNS